MISEKKQSKLAAKTLRKLQSEHRQVAQKAEAARRQFEKRSRKLRTLETKMAVLEPQAHLPNLQSPNATALKPKQLLPARLIFNPKSGDGEQRLEPLEGLVERLRRHGISAEVFVKTSGKLARQWAREAVENKEELVIVAAGDGTVEDVASQLVGSKTALGILPIGSFNNLAHALGIPFDLEQASALIGAGITRPIDVGYIQGEKKSECEYFLETAGLGLAVAFPAGENIRKGHWGKLPDEFRQLFKQQETPITLQLDTGERIETCVRFVTISNAPLYGLNYLIAPDAKMDDGVLDIAVYDNLSEADLASHLLKTAHGTRVDDPRIRFYRSRKVQIQASAGIPAISDKKEVPESSVLQIELLPRALNAIVGNGPALTWPVSTVPTVMPLAGKPEPIPNKENANNGVSTHTLADSASELPVHNLSLEVDSKR